jgi:hypothetical protein
MNRHALVAALALCTLAACSAQPQPDGGWNVTDVSNPLKEPAWKQSNRSTPNGTVCVLSSGHRGLTIELGGLSTTTPPQYAKLESNRSMPGGGLLYLTMNDARFTLRSQSIHGDEAWEVVNTMIHSPAEKLYLEWRERDGGRYSSGYQRSTNIISLVEFREALKACLPAQPGTPKAKAKAKPKAKRTQ